MVLQVCLTITSYDLPLNKELITTCARAELPVRGPVNVETAVSAVEPVIRVYTLMFDKGYKFCSSDAAVVIATVIVPELTVPIKVDPTGAGLGLIRLGVAALACAAAEDRTFVPLAFI